MNILLSTWRVALQIASDRYNLEQESRGLCRFGLQRLSSIDGPAGNISVEYKSLIQEPTYILKYAWIDRSWNSFRISAMKTMTSSLLQPWTLVKGAMQKPSQPATRFSWFQIPNSLYLSCLGQEFVGHLYSCLWTSSNPVLISTSLRELISRKGLPIISPASWSNLADLEIADSGFRVPSSDVGMTSISFNSRYPPGSRLLQLVKN